MFAGRDTPVRNSDGASCGPKCTVAEAMKRSINTVFYDVAVNTVGTNNVVAAARQAGIVSDLNGKKPDDKAPDGNIAIGGGDTRVSTLEMASAYATFAADGVYRAPHLVSQVLYPDGGVRWTAPEDDRPAFDPSDSEHNHQIARNVTESLKPVIEYSHMECPDEHPCAGKTGTHQLGTTEDNAKAWMVGYTPEISTAVSMGAETDKGKQLPLRNSEDRIVYGSGLPGQIWQEFMDRYLTNKPAEEFGLFEPIGPDFREQPETQQQNPDDNNDHGDHHGDHHGNGDGNGDGNGNGGDQTNPGGPGNTEPSDPGGGPITSQPDPSDPFPPIGRVGPGD
jgi:membrane peptidoglycan carboxypeptidase